MKNLFILGNGFDIDLGLNTTFKESQNNIIQNMKQYGINFDNMLKSNNYISIVYTQKGSQSLEFKRMVASIYNNSTQLSFKCQKEFANTKI